MSSFFCTFCGTQLSVPPGYASSFLACGHCGKSSPIPVSLLPSAQPSARFSAAHSLNYVEAVTFPFRRPDWLQRMWWLAFVDFIPVLNLILLRGWRLDVTRRIGYGNPQPIPELRDLGNFLGNGVILWFMTFLYHLPLFLVVFFFQRELPSTIWDIVVFLFKWMWGEEGESSGVFLKLLVQALGQAFIPTLFYLATWPLYRAAMLRFALTGSPGAFFRPFANLRLAVRHLNLFFLLFFFDLLSQTLLTVVGGALTAIGIGVFVIPMVLLPVYYWTTGHLYGRAASILAHEITGFQAPVLPRAGAEYAS